MNPRKEAICNALAAFVRQRPGLEFRNYMSGPWDDAGRRSYFADQRSTARDKRDAEALLLAVRHNDGITADAILEAAQRAFSGRLTITENAPVKTALLCDELARNARSYAKPRVVVDYCTGQYFPTEYRRAVAAVCAAALWDWQRENMPAPRIGADDSREYPLARAANGETRHVSAGDWLRRKFRETFGSAMQKRWFD